MTTIRNLILALFAMMLWNSCKKCEEPSTAEPCPCEGETCFEEMKDWFYFEEGSYWIYQEQNTGDLDTVYVYEAFQSDLGFTMRSESSIVEEYTPGFFGKFWYWYDYSGSRTCLTREHCTCHKLKRTKGRPNQFIGAATMTVFPFIDGNFTNHAGGGVASYEGLIDTLWQAGQHYFNVVRLLNTSCITESGRDVEFHYSKNIGMIRKYFPEEDEDWQLIEYQTFQ